MQHRRTLTAVLLAALALGALAGLGACSEPKEDPLTNPPDLSTPRAAMEHFLRAARQGDYATAAEAFDLRGSSMGPNAQERAARRLAQVLDRTMWLDPAEISNDPAGNPADGARTDEIGTLTTEERKVPLQLVHRPDGTWRIGRDVVRAIPELYRAHGTGWLGEHLPEGLLGFRVAEIQAWQWIGLGLALLLSLAVGWLVGAGLRRVAMFLARRTRPKWDDYLVEALSGPGRMLLTLGLFTLASHGMALAVPARAVVDRVLLSLLVVLLAWLAFRLVAFAGRLMEDSLLEENTKDPRRARGARTQIMVIRRVSAFLIVLVAASIILMQFEPMQTIGASVLASAGVLGIIVGIAAQRSIGTLIAGIQLSITQPIRVGDVIIVENEWGTVEEIALSYVVVKTWDLRRLVVPITTFLDQPFQNWSKTYSGLLGPIYLYADYRVPVDAVREELERYIQTRPEWDGDVVVLQVTDATDRAVVLRALVSAGDSTKAWDLRCAVRERLVAFLQELDGGRYLPRARVESQGGDPSAARPAAAD